MYDELLRSTIDRSINFITDVDDGGKIEARFVQRLEDTVIVYLSSTSGCSLSCRFCHLTQTGQTMQKNVTVEEYLTQARDVLNLVHSEGKLDKVKIVHYNFMARGDALANPKFLFYTPAIIDGLSLIAQEYDLIPKFKISTIFPNNIWDHFKFVELKAWINKVLSLNDNIEFYYSLYSLDRSFRKRWLPKALNPELVGELFANTDGEMRLHYALIDGENSSLNQVDLIKSWLAKHNIKCRFNTVRYNPYNAASGKEASLGDINAYMEYMKLSPNIIDTHLITLQGEDVYASCGMFSNNMNKN